MYVKRLNHVVNSSCHFTVIISNYTKPTTDLVWWPVKSTYSRGRGQLTSWVWLSSGSFLCIIIMYVSCGVRDKTKE
jgi:hypothetical protein